MERLISTLSKCPVFNNMSENEIESVLKEYKYMTEAFERGEVIFRAGDESRRIGIIIYGCLEMRKYLPSGNILSMFHRKEGEMTGGSIAFSGSPKYPCDVIAKEQSRILWIDRDEIFEMVSKNRKIATNILRISADRIMCLEKRIELFSFYSIRDKIAFSLINDLSAREGVEIILPFTKTAWAEYLNVSRTSLSRELKSMELDGIIKVNGNKIIPLDIGKLNKVMW